MLSRAAIDSLPTVSLGHYPTPVEELPRLRAAIGGGPRLLIKRDDAIGFGFGGNKIRKLQLVAARAHAAGADTLMTIGGVQSNHARATAAVAARLGVHCVLVLNGARAERPTANALLQALLGAEIIYVTSREEREPAMRARAERLARAGRRPFQIPLGASCPLGAIGYVRAVAELAGQIAPPDVIIHSTSSGGTQAGLIAGCELYGLPSRVIGISADDPASTIAGQIRSILAGIESLLSLNRGILTARPIEIDDGFVGAGYGVASEESTDALQLAARSEALFLDPTYTAKAMAALVRYFRERRFDERQTILFWHTGGEVGLFA